MGHTNPTFAKIPILDIGKFEQWMFRIQQYLQNEHYALWEVIEFGDSYKAPLEETDKGLASESSAKKKGRTVAITTEDMQKRRNDVKARTTLLLALPDEHDLSFSKYETSKELWEAILKTFGGNEATKKTKKNQLKMQYGNFKAEGSETLEQTFNRFQAIMSHLEFIDVEIEQDDLNQKFLTSLAPEWLIGKGKVHTASVPTTSTQVSTASTNVAAASLSHDTICAYIATQSNGFGRGLDWSYMANEEESHALVADNEVPTEFALMAKSSSSSDKEVYDDSYCSKSCRKNIKNRNTKISKLNEELSDCEIDFYNYKRGLSQVEARLVEFKEHEVKPTPSIAALKCNKSKLQSSNFSAFEHEESSDSIMSKPMIKFVKEANCPRVIKTNNTKNARKSTVKYAEMYRNISTDKGKTWPKDNYAHKSMTPRAILLKPGTTPIVHMTGNISYLFEYESYNGGYVSFGHGGGKITGKGIIKTGKLKFKNVYFVKELKYNLFSMPQICDNKNSVLFTDSKCIVLGKDFKLNDDTNVLLRTPRQHNMYFIDLNNIIPHKNLTCLVAKSLIDESMLWHRRLGHLNFKTMHKLVRNNLVKGLPSKCFKNDHTCVACLKRKQHKASCKTKLVNSVSKPLHTLHMDLFGPTSVSSLNHKWYCLVVTDDFSRFTWTFFLRTKDETSSILKNFITEIENLKDLKVKIFRCDNGGEFKNKEMNEFYTKKGIKREFSNARTSQQNMVAKRRNRTLIQVAGTMLADAKLPVTFWAEAVNTAYHLGKFDAKGDEENKLIEKGDGPNWLFDIDTLTNSMNYVPVVVAGTSSTNISGTKDVASQAVKKDVTSLSYIALPNWFHKAHMETSNDTIRISDAQDDSKKEQDCNADVLESSGISNPTATSKVPSAEQVERVVSLTVESKIPTDSSHVPTVCLDISHESSSGPRLITKGDFSQKETPSLGNALTLSNRFEDTFEVEPDLSNMETSIPVSPTTTFRIHKDHPKSQIIGLGDTPVQTRYKSKEMEEQSFIATIHQKTNPELLQFCLFSCFLSQEEPKKIFDALKDLRVRPIGTKWVLKNKKDERGIVIRNNARLVAQGYTQEEGIDYEEVFAPIASIEAIRLFLAYASFMGYIVYQMDVKSAFLYGTIDEEVYVIKPPRFQDLEFPDRVYKVEKAMYGLHQALRAWYGNLSKYLLDNGF
nr:hypothetical protein [Tanacetum cinerariifolium]